MSNEPEGRRLTLNDPISKGTLEQFRQIHDARVRLSLALLQLEQNKINLLGGAKRLDAQQDQLFQAALVERGLPPGTPVDVDAKTGLISLRHPPEAPPAEAPPAPPAEESTEEAS